MRDSRHGAKVRKHRKNVGYIHINIQLCKKVFFRKNIFRVTPLNKYIETTGKTNVAWNQWNPGEESVDVTPHLFIMGEEAQNGKYFVRLLTTKSERRLFTSTRMYPYDWVWIPPRNM